MKTLQHTLKLAMIACILVFASCSKDDSPSEDSNVIEEPSNHELLMSGKWYLQSTSNGGNLDECDRQSYFQFIDEDTLLIQSFSQNGLDCESQSLESIDYAMTGEDTFIFTVDASFYFVIELISETQLVLRQTDDIQSIIFNFQK